MPFSHLVGVCGGSRPLIIKQGSDSEPSSLRLISSRETRLLSRLITKGAPPNILTAAQVEHLNFALPLRVRTRFTSLPWRNQGAASAMQTPLPTHFAIIALATATRLGCRLRKADRARGNSQLSPDAIHAAHPLRPGALLETVESSERTHERQSSLFRLKTARA